MGGGPEQTQLQKMRYGKHPRWVKNIYRMTPLAADFFEIALGAQFSIAVLFHVHNTFLGPCETVVLNATFFATLSTHIPASFSLFLSIWEWAIIIICPERISFSNLKHTHSSVRHTDINGFRLETCLLFCEQYKYFLLGSW